MTIETGACLSRCVVMKDAKIQSHSWIQSSIIGWRSVVGRWVRKTLLNVFDKIYWSVLLLIMLLTLET